MVIFVVATPTSITFPPGRQAIIALVTACEFPQHSKTRACRCRTSCGSSSKHNSWAKSLGNWRRNNRISICNVCK